MSEDGIKKAIDWYPDNKGWPEEIISGESQNYYEEICKSMKMLLKMQIAI